MTLSEKNTRSRSIGVNRFMYVAFVLLTLYSLLVGKEIGTAMSNLGIALIFDPFDPLVNWRNRPLYQKVWLLAHLTALFGLLGLLWFAKSL